MMSETLYSLEKSVIEGLTIASISTYFSQKQAIINKFDLSDSLSCCVIEDVESANTLENYLMSTLRTIKKSFKTGCGNFFFIHRRLKTFPQFRYQ